MAHAQKHDFVFRRKGRFHLNRQERQFCRLWGTKVCASAVVILDTLRCEVVWRVLATHSILQFSLHFPSSVSPCAITFQLDTTRDLGMTVITSDWLVTLRVNQAPGKEEIRHFFNPYPTAFPYGNGMVLHFYQQQESSTTKTVHKVINKGLKAYV